MRTSKAGALCALLALVTGVLLAALAGPASAQPSHPAKPKPGVANGSVGHPRVVPKPAHPTATVRPQTAFTLQLNYPSRVWTGTTATITAVTNQDVGPTPYYIDIYANGSLVARCGAGTTCAVSNSYATPTTVRYGADIERSDGSDVQAHYPDCGGGFCGPTTVTWFDAVVLLSADHPTTGSNKPVTLTATSSDDVGPSPYYIEIYDDDHGTRLAVCGSGTTCSVTVTETSAGTHRYRAYVSNYDSANPPASVHGQSLFGFVTVNDGGWQASISETGGQGIYNVTATANQDVGPTPYWIEIFDMQTGQLVQQCSSGSQCVYSFVTGNGTADYTAFVSSNDPALPAERHPSEHQQPALRDPTTDPVASRRRARAEPGSSPPPPSRDRGSSSPRSRRGRTCVRRAVRWLPRRGGRQHADNELGDPVEFVRSDASRGQRRRAHHHRWIGFD